MLMFRDFVPKQVRNAGMFGGGEFETFESAVAAAGEWLKAERIRPMQLETVVLPDIWQFIRVWYDDGRDVEGHPFR